MIRIKEEHKAFDKHIVLGFMTKFGDDTRSYHPATGYSSRRAPRETETKGFGDLEAAVRYLNKTGLWPDYCEVNGARSRPDYWFTCKSMSG